MASHLHLRHIWEQISGLYKHFRALMRVVIILGALFAILGSFTTIAYAAEDSPAEGAQTGAISEDAVSPAETESANQNSSTTIEDSQNVEIEENNLNGGNATEFPVELETEPSNDGEQKFNNVVDSTSDKNTVPEADITEAVAPDSAPEVETEIEEADPEVAATVPDPYFYVHGDKHSFLPKGGDCSGTENCQVSSTPIQDALNAVSGGLAPDDNTIYIEGGIYEEEVSINEMNDLTLQGAADGNPTTLTGSVSIVESLNITLRELIFKGIIQVSDSADVSIVGTDSDDEINVELEGTVENLIVGGGGGDDEITIIQNADSSVVQVSGGEGDDTLVVHVEDEDLEVDDDEVFGQDDSVPFDDSIESLYVEAVLGDIAVAKEIALDGMLSLKGENVNISSNVLGNKISIQSADTTQLSGSLAAPGGTVHLLGDKVFLIEVASIDVSDDSGGGTVLLGGNYQGQGSLPTASRNYVSADAVITADALVSGDGGRVIVWADDVTLFYGTISAQGGPHGGNGGFIETSGKAYLEVTGSSVLASAPQGTPGTWLLDPYDVEVTTANANGTYDTGSTPHTFTPSGNSATVNVTDINNSLNNGTNVTITTGTSGTQNGDVTISSGITMSGASEATLRISAARNITNNTNQRIQSTNGKLNVYLVADSDGNNTGTVTINSNIFPQGGVLDIQAESVVVESQILAGSGTVNISARNGVAFSGAISELRTTGTDITINADSDNNGTGAFSVNDAINSNNGNVTITSATVAITAGKTINAGTGNITFNSTNTGFVCIGGGGCANEIDATELTTGLASSGTVTINSTAGPGNVLTVYTANLSAETYDFVLTHVGAIQFDNNLTGPNGKTIQIISSGSSIETRTNGKVTGSSLLLNAKDSINFDSNTTQPFTTQVSTLAAVISAAGTKAGINIQNTGSLTIGSAGGVDGITSYGGIIVTANSPLRVSKAVRENAGGDITLTAGNNSSALGDNLTIEADVVITGTSGTITGNAGDNISTNSGTLVSAPGGVNFNADLDTQADNGGGTATIGGTVSATNNGAAVVINAASGITITATGKITTNGGPVILNASGGTVTNNGIINVVPTIIQATLVGAGGGASATGGATGSAASDSSSAAVAALLQTLSGVLTVVSGQPVSLLEVVALGAAVNLQLPDGNGATFITGVNATVTLTAGSDVVLPAELPAGFELLDSLEIALDTQLTEEELSAILVSFGLPADTPLDELVILLYVEGEGWVEVPLEESLNGQIEGLAESGGVFVLAQNTGADQAENGSAQAALSGNTNQPVTLQLAQGSQVTVTGGAGDAVTAASQGAESLPGNLPAGVDFLNSLAVDVTQGGAAVSILPNGEGIEVSFDLPEGINPQDVVILYWLDVLNGGQGGWQTLTLEITPDGRVSIQTFFGGTFVLANQ